MTMMTIQRVDTVILSFEVRADSRRFAAPSQTDQMTARTSGALGRSLRRRELAPAGASRPQGLADRRG